MYNNFDELIQGIHEGSFELNDEIIKEPKLIIDAQKRTLTPESNFNLQVGVTNDYNTNVVSFKCDKILEHHSLVECNNKVIKWHNTSSNAMGSDILNVLENEPDSDQFTLGWIVPPEAITKAGTLKIAICFCDVDDDKIVYKWNSLIYSGLQVGQGMDNISIVGVPLSEIIDVNVYNRAITLPADYNTTIGIQGAYGTAKLTFRVNRFFNDWDFTEEETVGQVLYISGGEQKFTALSDYRIIESLAGNTKDDWIEFDWEVPTEIFEQSGNFSIAVGFVSYEREKIWRSKELTALNIEPSVFGDASQIPESSEEGWLFISQEELIQLLNEEYEYTLIPEEPEHLIETIKFSVDTGMENIEYEAPKDYTWRDWFGTMTYPPVFTYTGSLDDPFSRVLYNGRQLSYRSNFADVYTSQKILEGRPYGVFY